MRNEGLRNIFLSEGLLEAALPLMQPEAARGTVGDLMELLAAVADGRVLGADGQHLEDDATR